MRSRPPTATKAPRMIDLPTVDLTGRPLTEAGLGELASAGGPRRIVGGDFSGLDLGAVDLAGWQFDDCLFKRSRLRRAQLSDTIWTGCKAAFADFTQADLVDVGFTGCDVNNAVFRHARLASAGFERCKLTGADFTDAGMVDLRLADVQAIDARLPGVSFKNARLVGIDFSGALLDGADFRQVVFEDCSLRDAQLARARFEGADLRGADLGGIRLGDAGRFRGAVISRAQASELLKELGLKVL